MNFWKKVDTELEYVGKSRKELASEIGFDVTNISFGIKRNSIPSADTALKISRFLGVSLDYLLDMEKQDSSETTSYNSEIEKISHTIKKFSSEDLNAVSVIVNALNEKYKKN